MTDSMLLERVSRLGLPLMESTSEFDVNLTLSEVVKNRDTRLWEGFPVLLMNAVKEHGFDDKSVRANLTTAKEKTNYQALLLLSLALYECFHLSYLWMNQLKAHFSVRDLSKFKQLKYSLAHDEPLNLSGMRFDPTRLKDVFELYFEKHAEKNKQRREKHEELALEYSLSQLFSSKQKDLFRKKLDGLPLTKTEKEYYSRTVKKKVAALANPDLHRLAQRLMEY